MGAARIAPRRPIAFRLRVFLWSALGAVALLGAVLSLGWSQVMDFEVRRLDERLCMEARRIAAPPPPGAPESVARLMDDLVRKLRLDDRDQLRAMAFGEDGQARWSSEYGQDLPPNGKIRWQEEPQRQSPSGNPATGPDPRGRCELAAWTPAGTPGGEDWRLAHVQARDGQAWLAADLAAIRQELQGALTQALGLVLPLALLLSALGAWWLSGAVVRPLGRLREAMRGVSPQALDQRLPQQGEDREFQALIQAYNTMLDRLEASFRQASCFSADAAHELRTPLTILQGRIEQAIQRTEKRAVQSLLTEIQDEVGRLSGITRKLLLLSQADAGKLSLSLEPLDLSACLAELMDDAHMLAQGQTLLAEIEPGLQLRCDVLLLRQLLNNLVSNALRYSPPDGRVQLRAWREGSRLCLRLRNDCAPLRPEQRERFFERFYRADAAHGRQVDGTGLGLSLAREIARAHGGDLILQPGPEAEVSLLLSLPVAP